MALEIRTAGMYFDTVGSHGVSIEELSRLAPRLADIHSVLATDAARGLDGQYGCLSLGVSMKAELPDLLKSAEHIRAHFRDLVVIGIGGSSLGTKAIWHALKGELNHHPRIHFVENTDPYDLHQLLTQLVPRDTALLCISKSGGTLETIVQYLALRDWLNSHLGAVQARRQQWIVTDPTQGWLRNLAHEEKLPAFSVPPSVGGRYSVLSPVGLLPLAVIGVDVDKLLAGARANAAQCQSQDYHKNRALEMAALYYLLDTLHEKRVAIMMPYVNRLRLFVDWYCQLWAESLGKNRGPDQDPAGTLPVRAMGAVDQHSQLQMYLESRNDKMFTFIELTHWEHDTIIPLTPTDERHYPHLHHKTVADIIDAEFRATREVITEARHPNMTIEVPAIDAQVLGELIDLYERTTVYTGLLYGINPLDQPSVEKGKDVAIRYLETKRRLANLSDITL